MNDAINFVVFALKHKYHAMVAHRLRRDHWFGRVGVSFEILKLVAEKLGDVKLAGLFVEAQFHCMPPEFCLDKFKKKYPPAAVCFGGQCWRRYEEYIERGVRDAT